LNDRDPRWHDVRSLDLGSGALSPLLTNTGGYSGFTADENLVVRLASRATPDGGTDFFRVTENRVEEQPFESVDLADSQTTSPISFTADGKTRSEEHTSELQSRENLVCRLLLEKKK